MSVIWEKEKAAGGVPHASLGKPTHMPQPSRKGPERPRIGRVVRIGFGLVFIGLSAWLLTPRFWNLTSTQAVVNARTITLSAPIDGTVTLAPPPVGQAVTAGSALLRIDDFLIEHSRLEELKTEAASLSERVAALQEHVEKLDQLKGKLTSSVQDYHDATTRRMEHELEEANAAAAAARATREQRRVDMEQSQALFNKGFASRHEIISARLAVEAARKSAEQADAAVARLSDELSSVKEGLFIGSGDGRNDVPYSQQRTHEIEIQQLNVRAQIQEHSARIAQIQRQVQIEEERVRQRTSYTLKAPIAGIVWRRYVSAGSVVAAHSELLQLLDPSDLFVDAIIHERYLDEVRPGDRVRIKFLGSRAVVPGVVKYILGRSSVREDRTVAAEVPRPGTDEIHVIVNFERASDARNHFRQFHIGQRAEITLARDTPLRKYVALP